jgi:hypothetical protein
MQIPGLIELRKTISREKLTLLAISYVSTMPPNTTEMVESLVERQKINYTVFSVDIREVSEPYNRITSIPCSFFIDPKGRIKLATIGVLSFGTIKAIL